MISAEDLMDWLKKIDSRLKEKMTLVAVGGTAMTLLHLKPSTIDVDFCLAKKDAVLFNEAMPPSKFKVDIFIGGFIFSEQLPEDYADKSKDIISGFKNITLKALSLEDIIITKAARYNERDEEDIATITKSRKVDKDSLVARFNKVKDSFAGRKEDYEYHFNLIIRRHFSP